MEITIYNIFYLLIGFFICFIGLGLLSLFVSRQDQDIEMLRDLTNIPSKEEIDEISKNNLKKPI